MEESPVRVVVADPRVGVRAGLRAWLGGEPGVSVAAETSHPHDAISAAADPGVDVVLIDAMWAGVGTAAQRESLATLCRHVPVVVMGVEDGHAYADAVMAAGARAYWPKDGDLDELAALLRSARAIDADSAAAGSHGSRIV